MIWNLNKTFTIEENDKNSYKLCSDTECLKILTIVLKTYDCCKIKKEILNLCKIHLKLEASGEYSGTPSNSEYWRLNWNTPSIPWLLENILEHPHYENKLEHPYYTLATGKYFGTPPV